jgi:uncharacterized sporulation protein YeaH/YhbH (DUF444 family)
MSGRRIREDHNRYHDIIRDKVKHKLKDHIKTGQKITRRGDDMIVVDIPVIELPHFRHGDPYKEGVGAGEGGIGDEVGQGPPEDGEEGQPGENSSEHTMGVGVPLDTFIDILGEQLNLPKLKPKQNSEIIIPKVKYDKISKVGNPALLHKKRTLKNVIKRSIASNDYDPDDISNLYPVPEDKEYKSWSEKEKPDINAVIFFMEDISASMGPEKRELIRELCWYLECWIKKFYKHTELKYLVHDVEAFEVDSEKFYNYTSGGGTKISTIFELVNNIIDNTYPLDEWNIYCFYLSDGENWSSDNNTCIEHLIDLEKKCNVIGITEVKAMKDWAEFVLSVEEALDENILDQNTVITGTVDMHSDILDVLKSYLTVSSK